MSLVYIGLGSNLSKPEQQLDNALKSLSAIPNTELVCCSSFYVSQPMGPKDQPDFVNAVVLLKTTLEPLALLEQTQKIELLQGRERKENRWGPRTLDLDILLYGDRIIDLPDLVVPHYGMKAREFVLYPLLEIAENLILPSGEKLSKLVESCPKNGLRIIEFK
ncbi:2-amino-4-hydroxy-6-hydroxymethyldihydropteridine diphosphokinase [Paraglaciecola aquimarina]|uniref:2-amino-4-hydroxy-6-hydroxymethyldihydropteridine pyrophosphokinase n=1 Tax=Paraglaciecola algarum TaxID=3050085 RepID=A0ABS9D3F2_9ALTE|nr:2-amino-4-hydroxy-6-hydroxymethyldihydropteridine diphosphokinase [Paraglaciecola sp. G1-23]MCF2947450.1 2-amino-4-hydroxy-6-hydroxymethyldihydropteridine diphosphokinase [Paraglaciecola sp. G1-23]